MVSDKGDIAGFVAGGEGFDDETFGERDDGDGIGEFVDDPDFIVGAGADGDGEEADGDFVGESGFGASGKDREATVGGIEGKEPRVVGGEGERMDVAGEEFFLGGREARRGQGKDGEKEKERTRNF